MKGFVSPSVGSSIHPSVCLPTRPSLHSPLNPSILPFIRLCVRSFVRSFLPLSVLPFGGPPVSSFVRLSVCASVGSLIGLSFRPSIGLSVRISVLPTIGSCLSLSFRRFLYLSIRPLRPLTRDVDDGVGLFGFLLGFCVFGATNELASVVTPRHARVLVSHVTRHLGHAHYAPAQQRQHSRRVSWGRGVWETGIGIGMTNPLFL